LDSIINGITKDSPVIIGREVKEKLPIMAFVLATESVLNLLTSTLPDFIAIGTVAAL